MAAAILTSGVLPDWGGVLGFIVHTAVVVVVSTVVVWSVDRVARRALPLAALLQLSLVFPDQAPSRFKAALRSGSSRRLERQVAETRASGLPSDPGEAACAVVEMIGAIGDHDRRTRGHSERVRLYADLIGEELNLSPEERQKLQWGALLHDLGKLMVPEEILNKPGKPTAEEWAILQQHPADGDQLIEPLRPFLGMWADAIGGHHEKWDGSGYPRGLAGSKIPPSAAIVAVADSFEVMTAVRSYKSAMPLSEARAELTRCAGTHFDPEVVRAMLSVSLGRLRMAMGPLASLAHLPFLDSVVRLPATLSAAGSSAASAASVAAGVMPSVLSGVVAASLAAGVTGPPVGSPQPVEVIAVDRASSAGPGGGAARSLGAPVAAAVERGEAPSSGTDAAQVSGADSSTSTTPPRGPSTTSNGVLGGPSTTAPSFAGTVGSTATVPRADQATTTAPLATTTTPSTNRATTTVAPTTALPPPTTAATPTTISGGPPLIRVSRSEWRTNADDLQGKSLEPGATVYIFVIGASGGTDWWLASSNAGAPYSSDNTTPFDLMGTNANLSAIPFTVSATPGTYWVTVKRSGSGSPHSTAWYTVA